MKCKNILISLWLMLAPLGVSASGLSPAAESIGSAAADPAAGENQALMDQIESLKQQLIELNRDLFILEEELLFPANTQVSVLLSVDTDDLFRLDAIKLKIDDKEVTHYLYTERQVDALRRGGVQRLYVGNLRTGEHELTVVFTGYGPNQREYKRAATLTFNKDTDAKMVEIKITASEGMYQPEFSTVDL